MKKIILLFLCFIFCFTLISCNNTDKQTEIKETTMENNIININNQVQSNLNITSVASTDSLSQKNTMENTETPDGIGGGTINPQKYRVCFYQIPAFFSELVDKKTYDEWCNTYFVNKYPDNTKEMVMVSFIKEFNITRKDFDKANVEYGKFVEEYYYDACMNPKDFAEQEFSEVYNADIIYTFDNDLISEYYLGNDYAFFYEDEYMEALEAGTYETRTTDFVDIEQMEAEINAKYGTAEATTTEVTSVIETTVSETQFTPETDARIAG